MFILCTDRFSVFKQMIFNRIIKDYFNHKCFSYLQVYISSLALLKMLKHGRAGVPMEVMGLMLGEFVDDYTVRVIDVFAMPQSGTVSELFMVTFSLYTQAVNCIVKVISQE